MEKEQDVRGYRIDESSENSHIDRAGSRSADRLRMRTVRVAPREFREEPDTPTRRHPPPCDRQVLLTDDGQFATFAGGEVALPGG